MPPQERALNRTGKSQTGVEAPGSIPERQIITGTGANAIPVNPASRPQPPILRSYGKDPVVEIPKMPHRIIHQPPHRTEEEKIVEDYRPPLPEYDRTKEDPVDLDQPGTKSWITDIRIGVRQDGVVQWEPYRVQTEISQDEGLASRKNLVKHFPAAMIAQPFKWSSTGVIVLDVKINGHKARAIYDPGCVGLALSKWFVAKNKMVPDESVTLTILGAEGSQTLDRGVFHRVETKWQETTAYLSAVVLPLVSFDCLLGMSWIHAVGASLDVKEECIVCGEKKYYYQSLSIPDNETSNRKITLYANESAVIPKGSFGKVPITPFDQGLYGGMVQPELPLNLLVDVPIYQESKVTGEIPDWHIWNGGTSDAYITVGQKLGEWIAGCKEDEVVNKEFAPYFYPAILFPDIPSLIPPTGQLTEQLGTLLHKWAQCFSIDKYDVGRTGPPYTIKLLTGKPFKGYVPRRSPAAITAIREEVRKML